MRVPSGAIVVDVIGGDGLTTANDAAQRTRLTRTTFGPRNPLERMASSFWKTY